MRIAFDAQRFSEAMNSALDRPSTDEKQKLAMLPVIAPLARGVIIAAQQNAPKAQAEAMNALSALLCSMIALGFDAGRVYEDKEKESRITLIH